MIDKDHENRIERLKGIYQDFVASLSILKSKRDRILDSYEREIEVRVQERLRNRIDKPSV